jgi:hypothetical protein
VDDVAVVVTHHLDLHVARPDEQLLQVERPVTEGGLGLSLRDLYSLAELLLVSGHPDAPATASSRCLDHDGVADPSGRLNGIVGRGGLFRAGYNRHVGPLRQPAGRGLVTHLLDGLRRRPYEGEPGIPAGRGERGVLGQETVARMDPFGIGLFGGLYQGLHVQVALAGGRTTDVDGLVGVADVESLGVGVRVDSDRGYL